MAVQTRRASLEYVQQTVTALFGVLLTQVSTVSGVLYFGANMTCFRSTQDRLTGCVWACGGVPDVGMPNALLVLGFMR
jgi:hypothetical protein